MKVGTEPFVYEEVKNWGKLPRSWSYREVADVGVDSHDNLYILTRGDHPVIVLDRDGHFLDSWGYGRFARQHGVFIGPDDVVYCVDDRGHAVRKFTTDGKLLWELETRDHPTDSGYDNNHPDTVRRSGPPFNRPTGLGLSPAGEMYVTDGYGNARVHKFSADGKLLLSWGDPGSGPGQFNTPHDVLVDRDGLVYVADRLNLRVQVFTPDGQFLRQWSDVHWPNALCLDTEQHMYVAELGGFYFFGPQLRLDQPGPRVTVRNPQGEVLAELRETDPSGERFFCPHGIAVDSRGDVYVGEVAVTHTGGTAPPGWSVLRKYVRL